MMAAGAANALVQHRLTAGFVDRRAEIAVLFLAEVQTIRM
jgi:hypothetical protein